MPATPHATIAAHRFGLGEADLAGIGSDPQGWLVAQIGPAVQPVQTTVVIERVLKTGIEIDVGPGNAPVLGRQTADQFPPPMRPVRRPDRRPVNE